MSGVWREISDEREAQDAKWGQQNHTDGTGRDTQVFGQIFGPTADRLKRLNDYYASGRGIRYDGKTDEVLSSGPIWCLILLEEVYEALAETEPAKLRAELIQVAAVAAAWVEAIDRREA